MPISRHTCLGSEQTKEPHGSSVAFSACQAGDGTYAHCARILFVAPVSSRLPLLVMPF